MMQGSSFSERIGLLAKHSGVRDRLECAARATDYSSMEMMRRELVHYLELDAYLEDQGILPQL